MELTARLETIKNMIEDMESVADIGTDHGFLPVFLLENKISPKVIMTDISPSSLEKAKGNAGAYQFGGQADFRLGDGLEVIKAGEADVIVMAGMGAKLMVAMLERDREKTLSFRKYIFQPRKNSELLRRWISENGFVISEEDLVKEGAYVCEIIKAAPRNNNDGKNLLEDIDLGGSGGGVAELPPYLKEICPDLFRQLAEKKLKSAVTVLEGCEKSERCGPETLENARKKVAYYMDAIVKR